jgi:chromosome segregation protein
VRLTSLTLQGFKSFGHRTTLEFSPGVTAVVGPNGSGKSNLLDALKWVTGGGRAREFRAEAKTDLIFHGADGKRGVGFAEVEVELSDGRRSIKVRRDLDRAGQSRLRLDGRLARFLDVDEALAGSGLGTAGVAMIGQGEVAGVLMADPAMLLRYVAEAAGVARLAGRREQVQGRLDAARGHLVRLEDVLVELRERIEHLRHEAQVAQRHAELSREALALRVTAGHARVAGLNAEVAALRLEVGAAEQRILEGRELIAAARAAVEAARQRRTDAESAYREALAASERAQGALALAHAAAERAVERRSDAERARDAALAEATMLAATPAPVDPGVDLAAARRSVDDAEAAADAAVALRAAADADLERVSALWEAARAHHADLLEAWATYRARLAALIDERAALDAERAAQDGAAPPPDLESLAADRDLARAAAVEAEAELDAARRELEGAHERHAAAHAEAEALARAAARARAAFESRRGYAQGPRVALTSGVPGVRGSVADLLRVAADRQAAIAGALGRRSEYVVVDTAETAARVLEVVRRAGGWVTLLPLDLLRPPRDAGPDGRGVAGVLGRAIDAVDVEEAYRPVALALLAHTWLVRDLEAATALARGRAERPRLVTLEGDVLEAGGAISGGRRSGGATILGLGRDVEEAEGHAAGATAAAATALEARTLAQARMRAAIAGADAARAAAAASDDLWRRGEAATVRRREAAIAHDDRAARIAAARAALLPPAEREDAADLDAWTAAEAAALASVAEARAAAEAALAAAAEARREAEVGAERALAYEGAKIAHRQALTRAARLRAEGETRAAEVVGLAHEEARALARLGEAESSLPRDVEVRRAAFEAEDGAHRNAERVLRQHTEAQANAGDALEAARLALARREAALELALDEQAALPTGVEPRPLSERAARTRWREVEALLEELGPVNQRAAVDHAAQAERLAELESEGAQAAAAVAELASTLATIDEETNARLGAALAGLHEGFAEHVRQLFGPTAVGAIEVDREGARPVGLRIRLQPPGKRTESLNLLSVGERTMGAMAFLFALMAGDAGGLPIAVLDEVDAPLDEANIRRFCGFVEALSERGTQFVLITHQKATFEVADTLWGVTSDGGVSRTFSIRRTEPQRRQVDTA